MNTKWETQLAENSEDKSGSQQGSTRWGYSKKQTLAPVLTGAGVSNLCFSPTEALTADHKPAAEEAGEEWLATVQHLLKVTLERTLPRICKQEPAKQLRDLSEIIKVYSYYYSLLWKHILCEIQKLTPRKYTCIFKSALKVSHHWH